MFQDELGPIERFEWGRFTIGGVLHGEGEVGVGADIRLIGTTVSKWAERKKHDLTPEMITGVYDNGLEILFIGSGVEGRLKCPDAVKQAISSHGITDIRVLPTPEACRQYNILHREGRKVALLAHGTC